MNPKPRDKQKIQKTGGLSLLEMIVVSAIITIITAISLNGYYNFSSQIAVSGLAQDIASSIRLAQSYGLHVKGFGAGVDEQRFDVSYGIHFENTNDYELFRNDNRNPTFTDGTSLQKFTLVAPFIVSDICGKRVGVATIDCNAEGLNWMDIAFDRPDPDAIFTSNLPQNYEQALIEIEDTRSGDKKIIEVLLTGYIGVQ